MGTNPRLTVGRPVYDAHCAQCYEGLEPIVSDKISTVGESSISQRAERLDSRIRSFRARPGAGRTISGWPVGHLAIGRNDVGTAE